MSGAPATPDQAHHEGGLGKRHANNPLEFEGRFDSAPADDPPPTMMSGYPTMYRLAAASLSLVCLLIVANEKAHSNDAAHDMDRARDHLVARQGFQFRAVAHEPMVVDPVSAVLDRIGRLWVVEMPDYPLGPVDGQSPGGRIKILVDSDQDGRFDEGHVFADGLLFATGVLPWRDGAIVTAAGTIAHYRDLDQDLRADQKEVLFRGFAEQNQQLRANHPTLGPDGLVYVANGLRGGSVESTSERFDSAKGPVDLRGRDFVFDPDGGHWGAVAGNSQFGLTIDDFGRRLGCSNRNPAMMAAIDLQATTRDPLVAVRDAIHDVSLAAEKSRVVARADTWTTSNLHSGQFSAACGVHAEGTSGATDEWLYVCETDRVPGSATGDRPGGKRLARAT